MACWYLESILGCFTKVKRLISCNNMFDRARACEELASKQAGMARKQQVNVLPFSLLCISSLHFLSVAPECRRRRTTAQRTPRISPLHFSLALSSSSFLFGVDKGAYRLSILLFLSSFVSSTCGTVDEGNANMESVCTTMACASVRVCLVWMQQIE